jgi:rRNA small subunit pseudouridine methyltransferase Nep1
LLTLIIAEAALETVPKKIWNHPAVRHNAKRAGKPPGHLLLDRSLHHSAMKKLAESEKRGRPDITHFALLEALGSPLNKEKLLQIYVHTRQNYTITVNPEIRLPKNYNRFTGLIEQLFQLKKVPSEGEALLKLENKTLPELINDFKADYITAFTRTGQPKTLEEAVTTLQTEQKPAVIIGGFPHGNFTKTTIQLTDETVCVDHEMLEAWTLTSRVIYEWERALSIPQKRILQ